jgi:hypothetical protein
MKKIILIFITLILTASPVMAKKKLFPQLSAGSVLEEGLMNHLFQTVENTILGFQSPDDILGEWTCTDITLNCTVGGAIVDAGLYQTKTQTITFSKNGDDYEYDTTGSKISDFCYAPIDRVMHGVYTIYGNVFIKKPLTLNGSPTTPTLGKSPMVKFSETHFNFFLEHPAGFISCKKNNVPPDAPTALQATLATPNVNLTWSGVGGEDGFYVYRRKFADLNVDISKIVFEKIGTTDGVTAQYTDSTCTGYCDYKITSFDSDGESVSSSNVERVKIE